MNDQIKFEIGQQYHLMACRSEHSHFEKCWNSFFKIKVVNHIEDTIFELDYYELVAETKEIKSFFQNSLGLNKINYNQLIKERWMLISSVIDDIVNGAFCKKCNYFNKFWDKKDYTCFNCR